MLLAANSNVRSVSSGRCFEPSPNSSGSIMETVSSRSLAVFMSALMSGSFEVTCPYISGRYADRNGSWRPPISPLQSPV